MASKQLLRGINEFLKAWQKNLQEFAPYKTGDLKRSIKTFSDISAETVKPGVEMLYYGEYVKKKGTKNREYNPFKEKAWAATNIEDYLDKEMIKYVEKEFDKTFK